MAEQKVDVQAAFVRLVDDQRVVGLEQRIGLRFGQQDAVGHQLDAGARRQPILEAHLEADDVRRAASSVPATIRLATLDAAMRRGCVWPISPAAGATPAPEAQHDLRQLRGLARAGFAADDDDLVRLDRASDLVARRADTGSDLGKR